MSSNIPKFNNLKKSRNFQGYFHAHPAKIDEEIALVQPGKLIDTYLASLPYVDNLNVTAPRHEVHS